MLGLFEYSYDYYEWEELICVSLDRSALIARAITIEDLPLFDELEHDLAHDTEEPHLMIREVEVI